MKKDELKEFKKQLLQLKTTIMNSGILTSGQDLTIQPEDLADEGDLANNVINQQVSFTMRDREMRKLREIEAALQRIEDGTFGLCGDCDEDIDVKRLKNSPWASLCIIHAEEKERRNRNIKRTA